MPRPSILLVCALLGCSEARPITPALPPSAPTTRASTVIDHPSCAIVVGRVTCVCDGERHVASPASPSAVALVSGYPYACMLSDDALVRCWIADRPACLAESGPYAEVPVAHAEALVASAFVTCLLPPAGAPMCWGRVDHRMVGPIEPVPLVSDTARFTQITAEEERICGLSDTGQVECWRPSRSLRPEPQLLPGRVAEISSEDTRTCALLSDGSVFCSSRDHEQWLEPLPGARGRSLASAFGYTCIEMRDGPSTCVGYAAEVAREGWERDPKPFMVVATAEAGPESVTIDLDSLGADLDVQRNGALRYRRPDGRVWCNTRAWTWAALGLCDANDS